MPRAFFTPWAKRAMRTPPTTARGPRIPRLAAPEAPLPDLGPYASIPQRMFARDLTQRGYQYTTEVPVGGGRDVAGGAVVDFYLYQLNCYVRFQGIYWHSATGVADDLQAILLRSQGSHPRIIDITDEEYLRDKEAVFAKIGRPI